MPVWLSVSVINQEKMIESKQNHYLKLSFHEMEGCSMIEMDQHVGALVYLLENVYQSYDANVNICLAKLKG